MEENEYNKFVAMSERQLFDFVTEKDASQRKWVALYVLDTRRAKIASKAAWASALAAVAIGASGLGESFRYVSCSER